MEYLDSIIYPLITFLLGFLASIFTTYLNNKHQIKRDINSYNHQKSMTDAERVFNAKNEYKTYLIDTIEKVSKALFLIEDRVSLTRSVIDSSKKLSYKEFDFKYQEDEQKTLCELKSIVLARFPNYFENINKIEGLHNNYWGEQRLLLMIDIEKEKESYSLMQQNLIRTANKMSSEVNHLVYELKKFAITASEDIR